MLIPLKSPSPMVQQMSLQSVVEVASFSHEGQARICRMAARAGATGWAGHRICRALASSNLALAMVTKRVDVNSSRALSR